MESFFLFSLQVDLWGDHPQEILFKVGVAAAVILLVVAYFWQDRTEPPEENN